MFDCDFQDVLLILISLNMHETWPSFIIFESKFERWNERHFYGRPRAALSLVTPLPSKYCFGSFSYSSVTWWEKRFI